MMPEGYRHGSYGYAISSLPGQRRLLPEAWQLESGRVDKGWVKPLGGPAREARLFYDVNDDGKADTSERVAYFDLRYRHERAPATLWVSTLPLPRSMTRTSLDAVVQHYLAATRATGFQTVNLGLGGPDAAIPTESELVLSARGTLAGREARGVKLTAKPGDPAEDAPTTQVVLTFARPDFFQVVKAPGEADVKYPVLLVVGYENEESSFDALLSDYQSLLSRFSLTRGPLGAQLTWLDQRGRVVADASNAASPENAAEARKEADEFLAGETLELEVTGQGALDFDRQAALAALGEATEAARACRVDPSTGRVSGPHGNGSIRIVFGPSGYVQSATLEGGGKRFDGTPVGECVVGTFRMTAVPPFDRDPVSVVKRFAVD